MKPEKWGIIWGSILLGSLLVWGLFNVSTNLGLPNVKHRAPSIAEQRPWSAASVFAQLQAQVTCLLEYQTRDKTPIGNHTYDTAAQLSNYTEQTLTEGTGYPTQTVAAQTWEDFYRLDNANLNHRYTVKAVPDKTVNYDLGIIVYDKNRTPIITDSNPFDGNSASVTLYATEYGPYYFKVFQRSDQCQGSTYSLILSSSAPTVTPTPKPTTTPKPSTATPAPTWPTGFDQYEPNYDFGIATTVAPGLVYNLNFIPWGTDKDDNDFFKIWVKPNLIFSCETYDLAPGLDTNMILYSGPSKDHAIGGNDDRALGDYSSSVSYYSTYEGYLYLLVGHGGRISGGDIYNSDYKLRCTMNVPGTPTATLPPNSDKDPIPTATPRPTTAPATTPTPSTSPIATPTPPPTEPTPESTPTPFVASPTPTSSGPTELTIRPLKTPSPLEATPTPPGFRTFRVLVYYDENLDTQLGAGEGIAGFFIRVLSSTSGEELAHGYTDDQGQLSLTVPTVKAVRVLVPLLGFERLVEPSIPEVVVRIAPQPLPESIP